VRRILPEAGTTSPRKSWPPKHRSRGERYPEGGVLLRAEDSRHDWLQGGGSYLTLGYRQGYSCSVPGARGCPGIFSLIKRQIVSSHGIPMALFHDRHSIFERPNKEARVTGRAALFP